MTVPRPATVPNDADSTAAVPAPSGRPRPGRAPWLPAALATTTAAWGGNQFTPLLGPYETLRDFDQLTVNMLLGAYVCGIVPALFLAARLQRAVRLRTLVAVAVLLSLTGSILLAAAGDRVTLLVIGRVLSGLALGMAMVNGGAWIRRLTLAGAPLSSRLLAAAARVSALSLTTGFGLGATAAGLLAFAAPAPLVSAYVPHLLLSGCSLLVIGLARDDDPGTAASEATGAAATTARPLGDSARTGTGRLLLAVLPVAPWIFGSLGLAYAILPQRLAAVRGPVSVLYLTLLCATALTAGFGVQQAIRRVRSPLRTPAPTIGMALFLAVVLLAAWRLPHLDPWTVWAMSGVLGVAYGLVISGSLVRIQLVAPAHAEATLSALLYAFAYTGFGLPVLLAWASTHTGYPTLLHAVAAVTVPLTVLSHLAGRSLHPHRPDQGTDRIDHADTTDRATPASTPTVTTVTADTADIHPADVLAAEAR
ncbi:MFS transporter [Raineyella sp. LH-20]|uniref:MFS transporter n=1 Tax=Raineyella sp. LH-20 TaxID=3081204 RepID=UPI0029558EFC|nr:MFS transporter [Raineyella sp. LH-20]WOP18638.1 MFS transporter [Raineyella sp. LH-20]